MAGKVVAGRTERGFPGLRRGDCEPPVPANVGKYMRTRVVGSLRETQAEEGEPEAHDFEEAPADDLNVCCHGRSAAEEVHDCSFLHAKCLGLIIGCFV